MKTKKQQIKELQLTVKRLVKELNRQIGNINVLYQQIENIKQLQVSTGDKVYELTNMVETIQFTTDFIKQTIRPYKRGKNNASNNK